MKKQIQIGLFSAILYLSLASCRKPDESTNTLDLTPIKSQIQFVDYTTGNPISNLQVKRWNFRNSTNSGSSVGYKDSLITNADGNCIFEKSEANDFIGWSSVEYFDDYLETIYGNGIAQNNSLQFIKKEGYTRYYQAKLFPKIEVTVHIKQLTPIQPDSSPLVTTYLNLSAVAYDNGIARNEISLVTEKNFLPECNSCPEYSNYIKIKENELLDIKIKGYLVKNLFNNLNFSVLSADNSFFPLIIKQGTFLIENRIIGSQSEIYITF